MATFQVLKGSALGKAITGQGKAIATFTAREHQLAYSAIVHLDLHNDEKYLNALYKVTPVNYRAGLRAWATAFSKAKFDAEKQAFVYDKESKKQSKLEDALAIAPANYAKEKSGKNSEKPFDEIAYVTAAIKKLNEKGASVAVIKAMEGVLRVAQGNTLSLVKSDKPAKAPKPAAAAA